MILDRIQKRKRDPSRIMGLQGGISFRPDFEGGLDRDSLDAFIHPVGGHRSVWNG